MEKYHAISTALHALIVAQLAQTGWGRTITAFTTFSIKGGILFWFLAKTLRLEILDRTTLYRLYVDEHLTIRSIADHLHIRPRVVYDAMVRLRIPRRSPAARSQHAVPDYPFDEATLRFHYADLGQTIKEVAVELRVSPGVVLAAMQYWQIPRRRSGPKAKHPPPSSELL